MIRVGEDGTTIHLTRGDVTYSNLNRLALQYPIWNYGTEEEELYEFQTSDQVKLTVFQPKGYTKIPVLEKICGVSSPCTALEIDLLAEDTLAFEPLNKKKTYYYEITLNGNNTILGTDEDGYKKFIVYPSDKYPLNHYEGGGDE